MNLVNATRRLFKKMKGAGWESLFTEVGLFCQKYNVDVVDMYQKYVDSRKKFRMIEELTNDHHYHVDKFIAILYRQIRELDDRSGEIGTELLLSMSSLDPKNSFEAFDQEKLIRFAKFYPAEFSEVNLMELEWSLYTYIEDVSHDQRFGELGGISGLATKMVETGKDLVHPTVYKLLKLALLLPVATARVERSFSAMKIVKTRLHNRIGDE
ncbi:uncharacterized protein LOC108219712 [Daucus carota subsp. sativus]|uniref:uncharacterized protein LOC108219712 n=1 Tax=Daucus carota subsp. sativus TaxID=79200 RepID=UPI0007EF669F|nr:PREDICTED: uncharacterized protein LOC108219712 [Daucus carota subsp. sativus]